MIERNKNSIFKTIGMLTLLMTISKILGLVREIAIAGFFGVSTSTDAYFVAAGFVTNIFFGITVALSTVFVPYYIESRKLKSERQFSDDISSLFSSLFLFSIVIIIILFFSAPTIVRIIAPSFEGQIFNDTILYLRIYSVSIMFSLLTNLLTALFNAEKKYGFGAIASIVYSSISIICMLLLKNIFGVASLVLSVPLSFLVQLIILLLNVKKHVRIYPNIKHIINSEVKNILKLMIPVLLSSATIQINQLLTRSIASGLSEGSVSVLSYANTLFNFVSTLVMATFITVMFTEFSTNSKQEDATKFNNLVSKSINSIIIVLIPISVFTFLYSKDVVSIAYGRGAFDNTAVIMTASCLSIYSLAFIFDSIRNLLIKAFYSKNDMRTPLYNSIISFVITIAFSLVFSVIFGVDGIALAIVISIVVSVIFLLISAQKKICAIQIRYIGKTFLKSFASVGITSIILVFVDYLTNQLSSVFRFSIALFIGFPIYITLLYLFRCTDVQRIVNSTLSKIGSIIKGRNNTL